MLKSRPEHARVDVPGQLLRPPDHLEADVVAQQRVQLLAQVVLQQRHQGGDLGLRPLPVLDRERVEGQHLQAQARGGLHHVPHGVDAGAVPLHPALVAELRPTPVAVHDDRDVARQPVEVDAAQERALLGIRGNDVQQVL
jgi:hypothetical protein